MQPLETMPVVFFFFFLNNPTVINLLSQVALRVHFGFPSVLKFQMAVEVVQGHSHHNRTHCSE